MTVDVAGTTGRVMPDPRYPGRKLGRPAEAYRAFSRNRPVRVRHERGQVVLRDVVTGAEARGPSYLDALRALESLR